MCSRLTGYSLHELLLTIGIFALVLTLGLPAFGDLVARHRVRTEVDALFHAIHLARKESIMSRRVVTICPTRDFVACEPTFDWSAGWMMFANHDRRASQSRQSDEPILRRSTVAESVRIMANRRFFSLRSTELRATNGTIIVCDAAGRGTARALIISYTGRPRVALENRRGEPYQCAH